MNPSKLFLLLFGGLIAFCVMGCCSTSLPSVYCYIVNLENVNCTWSCDHGGRNLSFNYFFGKPPSKTCPVYDYKEGCSVGCIFPPGNRFRTLSTTLSNGTIEGHQEHDISENVKLHPPQNLTLMWNSTSGDISLHWTYGGPPKVQCVESVVSFQMGSEAWRETNVLLAGSTSYTFPRVSEKKAYLFRVKSRYAQLCGQSKYWSNWTAAVSWGPLRSSNSTDNPDKKGLYVAFGAVGLAIVLIIMVVVLLECERIKVIFVPVFPDPTKKLKDLFYEYDGNVEGWVQISPNLKDAFEPDFNETACIVTETKPI